MLNREQAIVEAAGMSFADLVFTRIRAQTRQALATIEEQLKRHGFGWGDIVDSVVWLRDTRDFAGMNEVYRELVRPDPPARATVRIAPSSPDALVEIMMVAERR